jgi:protease II
MICQGVYGGMTPSEALRLRESVIQHRDFVLIEAFQVRARHLIVFERSNCMQNIRIVDLSSGKNDFIFSRLVDFFGADGLTFWPLFYFLEL